MTIPLAIRKALKQAGLLSAAQHWKHRVVGQPQYSDFKPADPRTQIATLACIDWLFERQLLDETDYCEFGIYRGFNLWFAQAVVRMRGLQTMRYLGFDSFFGLPADEGGFKEGEFSAYRGEVESYLRRYGVDWERTILVEGFFNQTLGPGAAERLHMRPVALAVVDCDLYQSTVPVLEFLGPQLAPTAILYFDDWVDLGGEEGEPKAFAEFMAARDGMFQAEMLPDLVARGGKGKAFVLRRR